MRLRIITALFLGASMVLGTASCARVMPSEAAAPTPIASAPSGSTSPGWPTSSITPTPTPALTPTPTSPPTATCAGLTADAALDRWIGDVPRPGAMGPNGGWDLANADTSGYDDCAALSWIAVKVDMAIVTAPFHIMLFHHGEYLGTATKLAYCSRPLIVRLDDATIEVTYKYRLDDDLPQGEGNGRAVATYTWDGATVLMDGEVPPDYSGS